MTTKQMAKNALGGGADSAEFTDAYGNKRVAVSAVWIERHEQASDEHIITLAKSLGYISPAQFRSAKAENG